MSLLNTTFVQKPYTLNKLVTEPLVFSIPVLRPFLSISEARSLFRLVRAAFCLCDTHTSVSRLRLNAFTVWYKIWKQRTWFKGGVIYV